MKPSPLLLLVSALVVMLAVPVGAVSRSPVVGADAVFEPTPSCPVTGGDDVPRHVVPGGQGDTVALRLLVLLDGTTQADARRLVARVNRMYGQLGVVLRPTYRAMSHTATGVATDGQPLLASEGAFARMRPLAAGFHLVHLLTTKDLVIEQGEPAPAIDVAGVAACVGGAMYAGGNLAISESRWRGYDPQLTDDGHVLLMAHELGHVLGAQHEHGNCHEGRSRLALIEAGSCTAMVALNPAVQSEIFGSVERAVLRGYAEAAAEQGPPT